MRHSAALAIVIALAVLGPPFGAARGGPVGAKPVPPPKVPIKMPTGKDPPPIGGSTITHEQWPSFWGVQTNLQHRRDRLRGVARGGPTRSE